MKHKKIKQIKCERILIFLTLIIISLVLNLNGAAFVDNFANNNEPSPLQPKSAGTSINYIDFLDGDYGGATLNFNNMKIDNTAYAYTSYDYNEVMGTWYYIVNQVYCWDTELYDWDSLVMNMRIHSDLATMPHYRIYVGDTGNPPNNLGTVGTQGLHSWNVTSYYTPGTNFYVRIYYSDTTFIPDSLEIECLYLTGTDNTDPNRIPITPLENQWYTSNPILDLGFTDNTNLDNGLWGVDDLTPDETLFSGLNSDSWSDATWEMDISTWNGLNQGTHTLYFEVHDDYGNYEGESGEWTWTFKKDTVVPTTPSPDDGTNRWRPTETPQFTWSASSDTASGVAGYWIAVGDSTPDSGGTWTTNLFVTLGTYSTGSYTFYIRAEDNAGLLSGVGSHPFDVGDDAPTSNKPSNIGTERTGSETIDWILSDDWGEGQYHVLSNDTHGIPYTWVDWTSWSDGVNLNIPINRSLPGTFEYTIEFDDDVDNYGISDIVIVTVLDNLPTVSEAGQIYTTLEGSETVDWTLTDDWGGGQYHVIVNDTNGNPYTWIDWNSWTIDEALQIPINRSVIGTYGYTIEFYDDTSQYGIVDMAIVSISDDSNPIITIIFPNPSHNVFGNEAWNFNIEIQEPNIDTIWYNIEGSLTDFIIEENASIDFPTWDSLPNGSVEVTFYANDTAGNVGSTAFTVYKDIYDPVITVTYPTEMDIFGLNSPEIELFIEESNPESIWFSIDGGVLNYTFSGNGSIESNIWDLIDNGTFYLTFYANDSAGNIGEVSLTLRKDEIAPVLEILSPDESEVFGSTPPTFNFTLQEPNLGDAWYTLDDGINIEYFDPLDPSININQVLWESMDDGIIALKIYVDDIAGNEIMKFVYIVKDTTLPIINIIIPEAGEEYPYDTTPAYQISITELNLEETWYSFDGGETNFTFTDLSGVFDNDAWQDADSGLISIVFYALDEAGNVGSQEILIYKAVAPANFFDQMLQEGILIPILAAIVSGAIGIPFWLIKRKKDKGKKK
jgi:hypothetical protein